jgi:hypothetical protein
MENPERVTFYFYDGPEGYESLVDSKSQTSLVDSKCTKTSITLKQEIKGVKCNNHCI